MLLCNDVTKILLILLDKRVCPSEVWSVVSTVTGFLEIVFLFNLASMRLLCWVSPSMSDNHWLHSLNSTNTSQIPTDIFSSETKWTYNSSTRIFLYISITNWLNWIDNLRNFCTNLTWDEFQLWIQHIRKHQLWNVSDRFFGDFQLPS